MDDAVELADLIWQLRSELTRAMLTGEDKALRFRADTVELELSVALQKVKEGEAKVRFWVLEGGGKRSNQTSFNQTMRLTLRPIDINAPDESARVAAV